MNPLIDNVELFASNIAFEFIEEIEGSGFTHTTKSGIIYKHDESEQVSPDRWGKVLAIGPDVVDINVGEYILIESLRWTTAMKIEGYSGKFWITSDRDVMAISDELPDIK